MGVDCVDNERYPRVSPQHSLVLLLTHLKGFPLVIMNRDLETEPGAQERDRTCCPKIPPQCVPEPSAISELSEKEIVINISRYFQYIDPDLRAYFLRRGRSVTFRQRAFGDAEARLSQCDYSP